MTALLWLLPIAVLLLLRLVIAFCGKSQLADALIAEAAKDPERGDDT